MKRKAIIRISRENLARLFCLYGDREIHYKLMDKLPSDTEITNMWYDGERGCLNVVFEGSGEPFFDVAEGEVIPFLTLAYKTVEKKEPILMELKSEI